MFSHIFVGTLVGALIVLIIWSTCEDRSKRLREAEAKAISEGRNWYQMSMKIFLNASEFKPVTFYYKDTACNVWVEHRSYSGLSTGLSMMDIYINNNLVAEVIQLKTDYDCLTHHNVHEEYYKEEIYDILMNACVYITEKRTGPKEVDKKSLLS